MKGNQSSVMGAVAAFQLLLLSHSRQVGRAPWSGAGALIATSITNFPVQKFGHGVAEEGGCPQPPNHKRQWKKKEKRPKFG